MARVPPEVRLEDRDCPLGCSRDDEHLFVARDLLQDLPGEFPVVRCRGCGLMRTNPRPDVASMGFYYPDDYGPYVSTRPTAQAESSGGRLQQLVRDFIGRPSRAVPPLAPGRMLEIGCAAGSFLAEMARKGWECEGIEFSPSAALQARQLGLKVQNCALEQAQDPLAPFDLVCGWMVLEHLHEPIDCLRQLHRWTRPQGWLAISVPDAASVAFRMTGPAWYGLHVPNHLYHFDRRSISRVLAAGGWQIRRILWHRNPASLLKSFTATADLRTKALGRVSHELETAPRLSYLRVALGALAGATRQSGRMTVWAQRA